MTLRTVSPERARDMLSEGAILVDIRDPDEHARERESVGRLAFEALVLTAARSGEIRGALWSEVDLEKKLWTIPAERMKAGREHVVPLSDAAVSTFKRAETYREARSDLVFPGVRHGKPLSDMTLTKICRDLEVPAVPHGFRSSFRDWVAEETDFDGAASSVTGAASRPGKAPACMASHAATAVAASASPARVTVSVLRYRTSLASLV